ncbi:TPA: redox-sensing transcriptional repressor Rex [Candidatus Galligastranaerophilus faecipullorum]|nr:redox-sensing transcriptional repressor Rex [Candidatus Galligastranaerophilus faecipullorum]
MMKEKISDKTINRLTLYHCILSDFIASGIETITSLQIATLLKIDDSQVRKDISLLQNSGKSRVGYHVSDLKKSIEKTLGFSHPKNAFIVGAGNLGLALAKYDNFLNYGLNVLALFDNDPLKVGVNVNKKEVYHISKLPELAVQMGVQMVLLTVPRSAAQSTVDFLVDSNIKYIWNFSPSVLDVPCDVEVWNENLMGNFLHFSYKISN